MTFTITMKHNTIQEEAPSGEASKYRALLVYVSATGLTGKIPLPEGLKDRMELGFVDNAMQASEVARKHGLLKSGAWASKWEDLTEDEFLRHCKNRDRHGVGYFLPHPDFMILSAPHAKWVKTLPKGCKILTCYPRHKA